MTEQKATFILKAIDTFELIVNLSIPPEKPIMKGFLTVDAKVMSKNEVKDLVEAELPDTEYFDKIVKGVRGMQSAEGVVLDAETDAIEEVKNGRMSQWLMPAIVQAYFEQYGEARRKNLNRSRNR